MHQQAEDSKPQTVASEFMRRNMHRLAELVGLDETDCKILTFVVVIHNERLLDDTGDLLGQLSSSRVFQVLSVLLELPEAAVRTALGAQGILARSVWLITRTFSLRWTFCSRICSTRCRHAGVA